MNATITTFFMFMLRDIRVYKKRMVQLFIDYAFIETAINACIFGYLLPNLGRGVGGATPESVTTIFLGNILWTLHPLTFSLMLDFWFDFENDNYLSYQILLLPPWLVILQKVLFLSLYSFCLLLAFVPVCKLILGDLFVMTNASWGWFHLHLYCSVLMSTLLHMLMACLSNTRKIANVWLRVFLPLLQFGGVFVPFAVMQQYSTVLGVVTRCNPVLYISEGAKQCILGGSSFFAASHCVIAILIFSVIFFWGTVKSLRRKIDHV